MASRKTSKGIALRKGEYERKGGTFAYNYRDLTGKYHFVYAKTLPELRKKEAQINKDLNDGLNVAEGNATLNQLYDIVISQKKNCKKSSITVYNHRWNMHLRNSTLGNMKVKDIKKYHITNFCHECADKGLKKNTTKAIFSLINEVLEFAEENEFIRRNPSKGAMTGIKADAKEKKPLNEDEIQRLLEFCRNDKIYSVHTPFLEIAIGTCMRCSELCGLTWKDIDFKNNIISVNHQLRYDDYKDGKGTTFHIDTPKSAAGVREIPMTDTVHRAFLEIRKQNLLLGKHCTYEIEGYTDFVFINCNGRPYQSQTVNDFLRNIEDEYKKQYPDLSMPHISSHILRHTGCTRYATLGMDVKSLQNLMGHSSVKMTMDVYNHCDNHRLKNEMERISKAANL